jgi:hypothetical protein
MHDAEVSLVNVSVLHQRFVYNAKEAEAIMLVTEYAVCFGICTAGFYYSGGPMLKHIIYEWDGSAVVDYPFLCRRQLVLWHH